MNLVALAWGFAEATFFFLVPDVFLTRVALRDLRRALWAGVAATAGALVGGTLLWVLAAHGWAPRLWHGFRWLPGINERLILATGDAVRDSGAVAMLAGIVRGEPFKLFAVHAGAQHVTLPIFLGVALVARLGRFAATSLMARAIGRTCASWSERRVNQLHLFFWIAFYGWYFVVMRK
ncbi:MAG TPA: hypothetical protein VHE61_10775 [Opitutaceae bacterium]|nr:hypothetical protein [Opitutaceae bacterium]